MDLRAAAAELDADHQPHRRPGAVRSSSAYTSTPSEGPGSTSPRPARRSACRCLLVVAAARSADEHPKRKPTVVQVTSAMVAIVGQEIGGHDRGPARNQGETVTLTASKAGTWLGKASIGILWLPSPAHAAHRSSDPAGNSAAPCVSRPDR